MIDTMKNLSAVLEIVRLTEAGGLKGSVHFKAEVKLLGIEIQAYWLGLTNTVVVPWEQINQWQTPMWSGIFRGMIKEHTDREEV